MFSHIGFIFLFFSNTNGQLLNIFSKGTLELVHVVFRDGTYATDCDDIYPKDPYINVSYSPYGCGQLTRKGMHMGYSLGKSLRNRYEKFLGSDYFPMMIEATTTSLDRSITSMESVLGGLFPPGRDEIFESDLFWQPIPFLTIPNAENTLLSADEASPEFKSEMKNLLASPVVQNDFNKHADLINLISTYSGANMSSFLDVAKVMTCLQHEDEWDLDLPSWSNTIYPKLLTTSILKKYALYTGTPKLTKLFAGHLIKKIYNDSLTKISNNSSLTKMYLYSGRDVNLAAILMGLDADWKMEMVPYHSYVAFELHQVMKDSYEIRVFYQNWDETEPKPIKFQSCNNSCTWDQFHIMSKEIFPEDGVGESTSNAVATTSTLTLTLSCIYLTLK